MHYSSIRDDVHIAPVAFGVIPKSTMVKSSHQCRSMYLSSLGVIQLIAFWSYYIQFPGLLSSSGIEPVERLMPYAAPYLYQHLVLTEVMDCDTLCELFAVFGILISCIISSGIIQHGSLFIVSGCLYGVLVRSGATFYSFQWDTLLLEATAITAICYAPWLNLRSSGKSPVGAWPLRLLLFKLMYMSGIVKIQSECPTWRNLTALEYHFATQCLPGPLAWHMHQMHPFILRLSVALTLWIEIPAALLLIGFTRQQRSVGSKLQIFLQIMIISTGNYNFFNILTIVLCLPCLESDGESATNNQEFKARTLFDYVLIFVYLGLSFHRMFVFEFTNDFSWFTGLNVKLSFTKSDCDRISEYLIPSVVMYLLVVTFFEVIKAFKLTKSISMFMHYVLCIITIGVVVVPMCDLTPTPRNVGFFGSNRVFRPLYIRFARKYMISNGYGLFRKMTGVGAVFETEGWAGLPPSLVARQEIILEGVFDGDDSSTENWHELQFRWKPGNEWKRPLQVAPHQPR